MLLTVSYSESAYIITLVDPLKRILGTFLKFVYFLVINYRKYSSHVVDSIIFGISVPDYPSWIVDSNSLRSLCNFSIFCLIIFIYTTMNFHMMNSNCDIRIQRIWYTEFCRFTPSCPYISTECQSETNLGTVLHTRPQKTVNFPYYQK